MLTAHPPLNIDDPAHATEVVTKTEFVKIFMQATIVIQCELFNSLEKAYTETFKTDTEANAQLRSSSVSRGSNA